MKDENYVSIMGGIQLNLTTFEGNRFLRNIIRMPCKTVLKELGFLTVNDWCDMLYYAKNYQS